MFAATILILFITKIAKNALFRIPSLEFRLELPKISGTVSTSVPLFLQWCVRVDSLVNVGESCRWGLGL